MLVLVLLARVLASHKRSPMPCQFWAVADNDTLMRAVETRPTFPCQIREPGDEATITPEKLMCA